MRAGLKTRMQLPTEVASDNKRPDVVIRSSSSRKVVIVELTHISGKWGNIRSLWQICRVESIVFPSGSWRAGRCWTILVANLESHLSVSVGEKTAYRATRQRGKRGIMKRRPGQWG